MNEDELFEHAQTFPMGKDATNRVLENLRNLEPSLNARGRRNRRWIGASVATVAGILVVTATSYSIMHNSQPMKSNAHGQQVAHALTPIITKQVDGTVTYSFTGQDLVPAVQKYGDFPVKMPTFPSNITKTDQEFTMIPPDKDKGPANPARVTQSAQFEAGTNNIYILVQEGPVVSGEMTPFDALVGSGGLASDGQPQTINFDHIAVRVGWPASHGAHCYQFIQNSTLYFVKIVWNNNHGPIAANDKDGWSVVRSLIQGKAL